MRSDTLTLGMLAGHTNDWKQMETDVVWPTDLWPLYSPVACGIRDNAISIDALLRLPMAFIALNALQSSRV